MTDPLQITRGGGAKRICLVSTISAVGGREGEGWDKNVPLPGT